MCIAISVSDLSKSYGDIKAVDGISTTDPGEAFTKELIMRRSEKVYLLADSSKLGRSSLAVSGSVGDIDVIITDSGIPSGIEKAILKRKVKIIKQGRGIGLA